MEALPAEYRHEPALALAAGPDGLDVVRRILAQAREHLNPGGVLAIEVGHNQDLVTGRLPRGCRRSGSTPSSRGRQGLPRHPRGPATLNPWTGG
jgi:methylase of polypeptide subunit release factors